jgi:hypothetical protein
VRDTGSGPVRHAGAKGPVVIRGDWMAASRPSARRVGLVVGETCLGEIMRALRALVVAVVGAAAVLFAPGVATADIGSQDCDPPWFWWIPLPCATE